MKVYIVVGSTGEYEDRYEWNAKAFTSKEKADNLCITLNKFLEESHRLDCEKRDKLQEMIQESFDPKCSIDYTGTYYTIQELEVDSE